MIWKVTDFIICPLPPINTHNLWMVRGKQKANCVTMKEAFILHSAHMLLIFTASWEARKTCIICMMETKWSNKKRKKTQIRSMETVDLPISLKITCKGSVYYFSNISLLLIWVIFLDCYYIFRPLWGVLYVLTTYLSPKFTFLISMLFCPSKYENIYFCVYAKIKTSVLCLRPYHM